VIYAVVAWLVAAACAGVVVARVRRLGALELPTADALFERVRQGEAGEPGARSALDELVAEVDGATRAGSEWPRALSRVSLASGTALSILGMIERPSEPPWTWVASAFLAGMSGMLGAAFLGRIAEQRARRAREHWSIAARRVRMRLGVEPRSGRAASDPAGGHGGGIEPNA
jgi:hypothetical protein